MAIVNHLKNIDAQRVFHAVAYGRHILSGNLAKSIVAGAEPNHVITLQQLLGRGPWDGIEAVWFKGLEIVPAKYKFYPGQQSTGMVDPVQGQDPVFSTDTPHSNIAWLRAELPQGVGDADTEATPPEGLAVIARTMRVADYNGSGNQIDFGYSTNPARQVADLLIRIGGIPTSRIDWGAWVEWRNYLSDLIAFDYRILAGIEGFGLTGSYYNGTAFDTLVTKRTDPVIEIASTAGSPGVGINADNFTVRWEGFVKARFTETYTFFVTHTHGIRLWVKNLAAPLIDQWGTSGTHSATVALTAAEFADIKLEWQHTTGNAEIRLEWQSASQAREVITHRALYPRVENRPRFETHPVFTAPTRLDDAVRAVANLCNSAYQEAGGKLRFFSLGQISTSAHTFTENGSIVNDSVKIIPRDILNVRNSWQARFRDIDTQFIDFPLDPVLIERRELIDAAGRRIDGEAIELFNTTPHQAYRTLDLAIKRAVDSEISLRLTGGPESYHVLPGDAVRVDLEFLDETNREFLVITANDSSSEDTADERQFEMIGWVIPTAPSAPTGLAAQVISSARIDWSWSVPATAVAGYEVQLDGGAWQSVGNVFAFSGTGFAPSSTHGLKVRAVDTEGLRSAETAQVQATTSSFVDTTPPTTPTNLQAAVLSTSQIDWSWGASTDNVGVTGYEVQLDGGAWQNIGNVLIFHGSGFNPATQHGLAVRAFDAAGNRSTATATVNATTNSAGDTTPPTVPGNLQAEALSFEEIRWTWTDSTDNVGVTGYEVRLDGGAWQSIGNILQFTGNGFESQTFHNLEVRAVDAAGNKSGIAGPVGAFTF